MSRRDASSLPYPGLLLFLLLLAACAQSADPTDCPIQRPADISQMPPYDDEAQGPFIFPLDELNRSQQRPSTPFQDNGLETPTRREFHAAEDYLSPPGTPVYAIADGRVSFSGPMGGYGWLVIVDHPQADFYSLYGHLSPSRWLIEEGPVRQGDLLGYLGDPDENGGTPEQPLRPHLHLGLRAGQRADYPGGGEWRWQAGWITPCPSDVGWLQPSKTLTAQTIPPGGFANPDRNLLMLWGAELVILAIYLLGAVLLTVYGLRRDNPWAPMAYGALMLVAGLVMTNKGFRISPALYIIAAVLIALGLILFILRRRGSSGPASKGQKADN